MVLDDLGDDDRGVQDGLDIPVSGLDWDEVSFMTYRSGQALYSDVRLRSSPVDPRRLLGPTARNA